MTAASGDGEVRAAVGCRAHTGWAALVVAGGEVERSAVVLRTRVELSDPERRVRRNVFHAARGLEPAVAAEVVEASRRIAAEQAAAALERTVCQAADAGAVVRACAVVVGPPAGELRLESILASHALVHAAEGRLYQARCCKAPSRADSTPSRSRSGRSGGKASRHSASRARSYAARSTRCAANSGRPGPRTRNWRRSPPGSRSGDRHKRRFSSGTRG